MKTNKFEEKYLKDRQFARKILAGNNDAVGDFLNKNCSPIFHKILQGRLYALDLKEKDLIPDFYIYINNDNREKRRSFRFESKLQTWINIVAYRYLCEKYKKELQESEKENPPITEKAVLNIESFGKK